jgi:hypothetical protein
MLIKELLLQELEGMPDSLLTEVLNYLQYLKFRQKMAVTDATAATASISESVLAKDWLRPEEDEAWSHFRQDEGGSVSCTDVDA